MSRPNLIVEFRPGATPFYDPKGYINLPGTNGNYASTLDRAGLDITGDIDLIAHIVRPTLTLPGTDSVIAAKWVATGNQRSWFWYLGSDGLLGFRWSPDGTSGAAVTFESTVPVTLGPGGDLYVRVSLDVSHLFSNKVVRFYTASSLTAPWLQLGTDRDTAGSTSIFSSTAPLEIGTFDQGAPSGGFVALAGRVHYLEVRSGIGGTAQAIMDARALGTGVTVFADAAAPANNWTINGTASVVGNEGVPWVKLTTGGPHGQRLRYADWQIGRERDDDEWPPGQAVVELYNHDRLFDPDNTSGTYSGLLLPGTPFRIRSDGAFGNKDHFYGHVDDGWEQTYQHPKDGYCTVQLTDAFGMLPGFVLPGVFEDAVASLNPVGYWRLDNVTGEQTSDAGSGHHDAAVTGGVTFDQPPLLPALGPSADFDGTGFLQASATDVLANLSTVTCVAVFSTTTGAPAVPGGARPIFCQDVGSPDTAPAAKRFSLFIAGTPASLILGGWFPDTGGTTFVTAAALATVIDGLAHIGFAQTCGLSGDPENWGVAVDSAYPLQQESVVDIPALGKGTFIGSDGSSNPALNQNKFDGRIQHVTVFDRSFTTQARQYLLDRRLALTGQRSDQQIRWALNRIGVPDSYLNLDVGRAIMGPADTKGRDGLEWCRDVQRTEQGALFVDHPGGGKIRFRERFADWLATRSTTVQATFSDDPAAVSVVRVEPETLVVEAAGRRSVINRWTVTWAGGEESVDDEPSRKAYGSRGETIDTVASVPAVARGIAQFRLAQTKDPQTRIRGLGWTPSADESGFSAALNLQIGDRVRYRSQPSATGSVTDKQLHLLGMHTTVDEMTWKVQIFTTTAPAAHQQLFTLGTSTLNGTHILAV